MISLLRCLGVLLPQDIPRNNGCTRDGNIRLHTTSRVASVYPSWWRDEALCWDIPTHRVGKPCNAERNGANSSLPAELDEWLALASFLSSIAASPPSTFFSCALTSDVAARVAERVRKLRRELSVFSLLHLSDDDLQLLHALLFNAYLNVNAPCLQFFMQSIHATQRL